jgi:rubrerythrin
MLEQALLTEQFQSLLSGELQAAEMYTDLATRVNDPSLRQQVQRLLREKERHVRLAERLLEILD